MMQILWLKGMGGTLPIYALYYLGNKLDTEILGEEMVAKWKPTMILSPYHE